MGGAGPERGSLRRSPYGPHKLRDGQEVIFGIQNNRE
jgi:hypothetical protein